MTNVIVLIDFVKLIHFNERINMEKNVTDQRVYNIAWCDERHDTSWSLITPVGESHHKHCIWMYLVV